MNWITKIRLWWWDNISFPLWYRFGSKESHQEIEDALRKRRQDGGCSMWQNHLKNHPEDAKYDWEKEYVKTLDKK